MKKINNVTVGADIELFLQNRRTKKFVSAEGLIQGTKWEPFNFDPSNKYFAISLDNVSAEFCIPPAKSKDEFVKYIAKSRSYIDSIIPKRLCTAAVPAVDFHPKWLKTENAQTFGCDPDFNVWLREQNPRPTATNSNLRSAGGHIHVGYDNPEFMVSTDIVKAMDLFVGVPSVLQEPDNERKLLYGKAGSFREKEYGVEYRSVSNYYLQDEKLTEWVFGATINALDFVNDERMEEIEAVDVLIQQAINNNDKTTAQNLINQFNLQLA